MVIGDTGSTGQHVLSPVEVEADTEFVHATILFPPTGEKLVPERCIKPTRIVMHSVVLVDPVSRNIDSYLYPYHNMINHS